MNASNRRVPRTPGRRLLRLLLTVGVLVGGITLVSPAVPSAAVTGPPTLVAGPKPSVPGSLPTTTGGYTPVAGHFGSDGPDDVLWSGSTDLVWRGSAQGTFDDAATSHQVPGKTPLVGDYNGDGVSDVFWYAAGSTAESYWKGTSAGGFTTASAPSVSGTYTPVVSDFTGDHRSDIFWYAPGSGAESMWKGTSTGSFSVVATSSITRTFVPVAADFNGDGRGDIYWYAAGSTAEVLWLGKTDGTFTSTSTRNVSGTYKPVAGDYNGDGRGDIYWYAPGSGAESLWLATSPTTGFTVADSAPAIGSTYKLVAGDFNGDSCSDIYLYASGSSPDSMFMGSSGAKGCYPPQTSCPTLPGLDRWDWIGGDISEPNRWGLAVNWAPAAHTVDIGFSIIPGQRLDSSSDDDYVCIPADGTPEMVGAGQSANILVLENLGTLTVGGGAKLELKGKAPDTTVYASHSHDLVMPDEATLFGDGELIVRSGGDLALQDSLSGTPTLSTRDGDLEDLNSALPSGRAPLHITIATAATLTVTGDGINLFDHTVLTNFGTTTLADPASYIAADYGTAFENHGTFDFAGNGDYVQGIARPAQPLGTFLNDGLLLKSAGTGVSVIDAKYSLVAPGSVSVASGQISLFVDVSAANPPAVNATLEPGTTLTAGGCDTSPSDCTGASSSTADTQFAALTRPLTSVAAPVTLDLDPPTGGEPLTLGKVIVLTAATVPSAADPMIFKMTVDATIAAGRDKTTMALKHDGVTVPDCAPVPSPAPACVNRTNSTGTVGFPVTLEIWTTQNGRWRFL